jgi:hypothetical protein
MDPTQAALLNVGSLNQLFGQATQPFNNFVGQNLQHGLQLEQARQQQAMAMQRLQFENQLALQRQQQEDAARMGLQRANALSEYERAQLMERGAQDRGITLEKLRLEHEDNATIKKQADTIRQSPDARELIGGEISTIPDTPEGNRALIERYNNVFGSADNLEKVHTKQAVALTKQIRDSVGRLSSNVSGSPQSREAIQRFLADPTVSNVLAKKGKMSAQEIQKIAQSGDPSQISKLIDQVASEASLLYGTNRDVASQLLTAWNAAQLETKSQPTPDQLVNVDYLKSLMARRDALLGAGTIRSEGAWNQIADAAGFGKPPEAKLPPPPPSAGISAAQRPIISNGNPFAPPPDTSSKVGLAKMFEASPASIAEDSMVYQRGSIPDGQNPYRSLAFGPARYATDPHTEYELRSQILESTRKRNAFLQGLSQAVPLVPNYQPDYTAVDQVKDEDALKKFVAGLYSPSK